MGHIFVDENDGDNGNGGASMSDAFATLEHVLTAPEFAGGDTMWVRRTHNEQPSGHISVGLYTAYYYQPTRVIGWPRASHVISSSDWSNGSTSVTVDDNDMVRERHLGRYIIAPDGRKYLITRVSATSTIIIDREYAGPDANNASATILADEEYVESRTVPGGDLRSTWDADPDNVPHIDMNGNAYWFSWRPYAAEICNFEFKNSTYASQFHTYGMTDGVRLKGVLIQGTTGGYRPSAPPGALLTLERVIIETSGDGLYLYGGLYYIKDCAFYNNAKSIQMYSGTVVAYLENVNLGVEQSNSEEDIEVDEGCFIIGRDVKFGSAVGELKRSVGVVGQYIQIENYNKVLGAHKTWNDQGTIIKTVADGTGDAPNQRSGGNDTVIEVLYNADVALTPREGKRWSVVQELIFEHEIDVSPDTYSFRYYVQNMGELNENLDLFLEAEYVQVCDDASEYVIDKKTSRMSHLPMPARANQSDWDEYIEVLGVVPAVTSKVRIRCHSKYLHATNKIFIDPKVEINNEDRTTTSTTTSTTSTTSTTTTTAPP